MVVSPKGWTLFSYALLSHMFLDELSRQPLLGGVCLAIIDAIPAGDVMDVRDEYRRRLTSAEDAVRVASEGDLVVIPIAGPRLLGA